MAASACFAELRPPQRSHGAALCADFAERLRSRLFIAITTPLGAALCGDDSHASMRSAVSVWRSLRETAICSVPGGSRLARSRKRPASSVNRWASVVVCLNRRRRLVMISSSGPKVDGETLTRVISQRANLGKWPLALLCTPVCAERMRPVKLDRQQSLHRDPQARPTSAVWWPR